MLDLNDCYYFVQIIDRGGFTAASRSLGVPKSTLSHRMRQLESGLRVRLINRTSRRLSVTDVGNEFYRYAASILQQADAAEGAVRQRLSQPCGAIRLTTSPATAQFAMETMLPQFISRFPSVKIVHHMTNRFVDIVSENYDVAVRAHSDPLPDSTLVQRALAPVPWALFAGPSYLDRAGTPQTPDDLASHNTLFMMLRGIAPAWRLRHPTKGDITISIEPRVSSDDMIALKQSACAGLGIVALPSYVCRTELRTGELRRVLPDWSAGDATLTALIPFRRGMLPSVRAFVDFIAAEFPRIVAV